MRIGVKVLFGVAAVVFVAMATAWLLLPKMKDRQTSGEITLPGLSAPVRVLRDEFATPYIYAESMEDALRAQGFVAGQDRLFQLEAVKRAATGRLAEAFGAGEQDAILNLDREARVIGFHRIATRQAAMLSPTARGTLEAYLSGLNAYIGARSNTHPTEFKLAGFAPEAWAIEDLLALMYYLGWGSAANFDAELIAHRVIQAVGAEAFEEIAPITVNPDSAALSTRIDLNRDASPRWAGDTAAPADWTKGGLRQQGVGGSNNWAISGAKAGARAAIVTNDPHLDSRLLPGPWHPIALITPTTRAVGVSIGLPGVLIGRNEHVAFGVTNAYADAVDLYVETVDPKDAERYLEGDKSIPFETITEVIRVKSDNAEGGIRQEPLIVRLTRRGPVITDHDPELGGGAVLSMRWASVEYMDAELGVDALMTSATMEDALSAIETVRAVSLNFVVGDVDGRIARRASGAAPIRLRGDGMTPFPIVDSVDNWGGRIPADQMPGEMDPARGWTGSANHMTAPADYPFIYTTYASPSYRYRRIGELFNAGQVSADDAWAAQYDTLNLFARGIAPILSIRLLEAEADDLREVGDILAGWDHHDEAGEIAPTLFQELVRQLANAIFEDELGPDATADYLSNWYVWQERFDAMVKAESSSWFDDKRTEENEDLTLLVHRAGRAALKRLTEANGTDRSKWRWGAVHQIHFSGPLRRDGLIGRLTGNRSVQMSGSGETLLRALYPYHEPFNSKWTASLRMTADLNDPDKVRAVLPGGVVGRTFHPNLADQTAHWAEKDAAIYWWFSDEAIKANAKTALTLAPTD